MFDTVIEISQWITGALTAIVAFAGFTWINRTNKKIDGMVSKDAFAEIQKDIKQTKATMFYMKEQMIARGIIPAGGPTQEDTDGS